MNSSHYSFLFCCCFLVANLSGQAMFTNQVSLVPGSSNYSGVAMGVADLNGDGLDDIFRLIDRTNPSIAIQQASGNFIVFEPTIFEDGNSFWGLCIADVDGNGINDIAMGGAFGGTYILMGEMNGTLSWTRSDMPPTTFQQASNFVDIDNDGLVDHFGCDDVDLSVPSKNMGNGVFVEDYSLINPVSTVPSDNSGNYASIWTDFDDDGDVDLYISKCRLGVSDINDGRRLNQLFVNDGVGGFTDQAEAKGLLPRSQCWSTDFADVDNDGDLDAFMLNHDIPSQLFINDGTGVYTDETAAWGIADELAAISSGNLGIQCNFEDFNNDGFIDIIVSYTQGFAQLYMNDTQGGYNLVSGAGIISELPEQIFQSVATGDLNNDGYIDMYIGHANGFNNPSGLPDALLMNAGGNNNHLMVSLQGLMTNTNGIGAKIKLFGAWGTQVREIRSGEGYGVSNSMTAHFGLGSETVVDSMVIIWPSGLVEYDLNVTANNNLAIVEGSLSSTLPLEWLSLSATAEGDKLVRLDWQTVNEEGTSHFIIERQNSRAWQQIGRLAAENTVRVNTYTINDENPTAGENIYRIRQLDLTGEESVSPLALAMIYTGDFSVYPNPASGRVSVQHPSGEAALFSLETLDGKIVRQAAKAVGGEIDLTGVTTGIYLLRSGEEVRKLVVKR
jgi:hypothetical protein